MNECMHAQDIETIPRHVKIQGSDIIRTRNLFIPQLLRDSTLHPSNCRLIPQPQLEREILFPVVPKSWSWVP